MELAHLTGHYLSLLKLQRMKDTADCTEVSFPKSFALVRVEVYYMSCTTKFAIYCELMFDFP